MTLMLHRITQISLNFWKTQTNQGLFKHLNKTQASLETFYKFEASFYQLLFFLKAAVFINKILT